MPCASTRTWPRAPASPARTAGAGSTTTSAARILFPIYDDRGDPISFGGRILPGGEGPGQPGQVQEHHRDAALQQVQGPLRPRPVEDVDRHGRHGRHLRGLHRRHRVPPCRRSAGRGDLRHRAHRRPRAAAHPVCRPAPGAGVRRRRRRAGRGRALLPLGARARPRGRRGRPAAGPGPGRRGRLRPRAAGRRGRGGDAVPAVPARPGVRRRRPGQQRGPGPGGRAGDRDRRRAPDRPRARPVRDGRVLALPGRARSPALAAGGGAGAARPPSGRRVARSTPVRRPARGRWWSGGRRAP